MKKFFSLVLALVMALSLTTVAWGAEVDNTAALNTALGSAVSGEVIKLAADTTYDLTTAIPAGVTLEGAGASTVLTLGAAQYKISNNNVTIKNVTIKDEVNSAKAGLYVAGVNVTLESVNYASANQVAITLRNMTTTDNTFTLKDSTVSAPGRGIGWCYFTGTILVENSVIDSCNSIHIDQGGNTAKIVVKDSTLYGGVAAGSTGSFEFDGATFEASKLDADYSGGVYSYSLTAPRTFEECTFSSNSTIGMKNVTGAITLVDCNLNGTPITAENITTLMPGNYADANVTVDGDVAGAVAEVGGVQYKSLTEAMKAVTAINNTLTLLDDVTVSTDWDCRNTGAKFAVPVTIDGKGHTLKFTGKVYDANWNTVFRFEDTATVKNLTIDASAATDIQRGISAKLSITVENCKLIGNGSGYGVIFGEGAGADIGNVTATITNSTFTNWAKGVSDNANAQDAKSVSITGSTFDNADVNVSAKETVTFTGNTVDDGSVIIHTYTANSDLAVTATGNTLDADEVNKIKAETITTDTNDFATTGTLAAPAGYVVLKTTAGTTVVVPAVTSGDKFDLYQADAGMKVALAAGAEDVSGLSFTNMSANANQDGSGNLAYISANNGEYFVKTTSPTIADFAVTVAGKIDVLYYVSVVDLADVQYGATAKAFTNFGTKCGQLYRVDTTKEYYVIEKAEAGFALAKDDVSYVVNPAARASYVNVLVGNEIKTLAATRVDDSNTVLTIDEILGHNWAVTGVKATTTGKTVPTQVTCLNCSAVVTKFYDAATKVPAGTVATPVPGYEQATNTHDAWFFVEPAAATTPVVGGATSGTVVESAPTFDAGIAMYVGMSVMAAAGSAVVIGKKKD